MALVLVSPWCLPLASLSMPIRATQTVSSPAVPTGNGGPRRPGAITAPATNGSVDLSNQRGRAVPSLGGDQPGDKTLADADMNPARIH